MAELRAGVIPMGTVNLAPHRCGRCRAKIPLGAALYLDEYLPKIDWICGLCAEKVNVGEER